MALKHPAMAEFHQLVIDLSTPGHPSYGQHISKDAIEDLLKPDQATLQAVTDWLQDAGVSKHDIQPAGHWIMFNTSVRLAEAMLDARFHYYNCDGVDLVRTLRYAIPPNIRPLVDMIQPTTRFGRSQPVTDNALKARTDVDNPMILDASALQTYDEIFCNTTTTPACIRGLYNIDDFTASAKGSTRLGVSGFIEQVANFKDMSAFLSMTDSAIHSNALSFISINDGPINQQGANRTAAANLNVRLPVTYFGAIPD